MGLGIPLLRIEIMLESSPLKSRMLVRRLAVLPQRPRRHCMDTCIYIYIYALYIYIIFVYIYIYRERERDLLHPCRGPGAIEVCLILLGRSRTCGDDCNGSSNHNSDHNSGNKSNNTSINSNKQSKSRRSSNNNNDNNNYLCDKYHHVRI